MAFQIPTPIDLIPLEQQLHDAGFDVSAGLGMDDNASNHVYTYDEDGQVVEFPAQAQSTIDAYLDSVRNPPSQTTSSTSSTKSKSSG